MKEELDAYFLGVLNDKEKKFFSIKLRLMKITKPNLSVCKMQ